MTTPNDVDTGITAEWLRSVFRYEPETGMLFWRKNLGRAKAGQVAGKAYDGRYVSVRLNRRLFKVHRLAFLYMTGRWPDAYIDHVNDDKSDNRWVNLREATKSENGVNWIQMRQKHDLPRGVTQNHRRYMATISVNKNHIYLGTFDTPEEAHEVWLAEANKLRGEFLPESGDAR